MEINKNSIIITFIIALCIISCKPESKYNQIMTKGITDTCNLVKEKIFADTNCNIITYYCPKKMMGPFEYKEYLVFKKFGIVVVFIELRNELDSCTNMAEEVKLKNDYNLNLDSIYNYVRYIDSLCFSDSTTVINYMTRFHDSAWNFQLQFKYLGDGKIPKPLIGTEEYIKFVYSIFRHCPHHDIWFKFWVTIDTSGNVESVEVINHNCNRVFEQKFIKKYKKLKWSPATFNGEKVRYRFKETFFI